MSVEASEALERTKDSLLSKNGGVLFVAFLFTTFLIIMAIQSRIAASDRTGPLGLVLPTPFVEASDLALGIPYSAAVVMLFVGLVVGSYFAVVAIRVFVHGYEGIPREAYAENVLHPTAHLFLGTLVFAPLFAFGFALVILPGAFVAVSLGFYSVYTSIHDDDFVDAYIHSWELSDGHRLPLYLMFGAFLLAGTVITALGVALYVFVWGINTVLAEVMLAVWAATILLFTLALVSAAYTTIRTHYVRRNDLGSLPGGEEEAERIGG